MIPFGLSAFGFRAKRLNDVKTDLDNQFIGQFGDVNLAPQSVIGQIIGVFSKVLADIWENQEQVYFSQYPNSADGVALDNVVQFNGITRLPKSQTAVTATCAGIEGTAIPPNSLALIPSTNETFFTPDGGIITSFNADFAEVTSSSPPIAQPYTVIISNEVFTYSRPTITFSNTGAIFVPGNIITVYLNGIQLPAVPYNTSSNQTLQDILTQIKLFPTVDPATFATNPDTIQIRSLLGFSTTVTDIQFQGAGSPTYSISYTAPPSMNAISERLVAVINQTSTTLIAEDLTNGKFTITADSPDVPFSLAVANGMSITARSSPIKFLSENYGPVPCPANSLTQIVTPIAGWSSITNKEAGVLGRFVETDAELRLRRLNSLRLLGRGTIEAIRAQLLAVGATSALVFENITMLQNPAFFTLASDMTSGDSITIQLNGITQTPVPFNTDMLTTMTDLALQIEAFPGVDTATPSGIGNRTMDITFIQGYEVQITDILITPSSINVVISNGRPPKSFEAVVQGQTNDIIANTIWLSKPAGIQTFGTTQVPIIDSQGNTQEIFFSRPTQIYIWVDVVLTLYTEENFPTNGLELVEASILNYINNLGIGVDVLLQRVNAQIFVVPGIASGVMQIAATFAPEEVPSYSTSNIPIAENQVAITQPALITVTI